MVVRAFSKKRGLDLERCDGKIGKGAGGGCAGRDPELDASIRGRRHIQIAYGSRIRHDAGGRGSRGGHIGAFRSKRANMKARIRLRKQRPLQQERPRAVGVSPGQQRGRAVARQLVIVTVQRDEYARGWGRAIGRHPREDVPAKRH